MITLLIIILWLAIAGIYLLQYQIVKDYQPYHEDWTIRDSAGNVLLPDMSPLICDLKKYSIFDFKRFAREL